MSADMYLLVTVLLSFIAITLSAPEADRVIVLPGIAIQPAFKHYSGYLKANGDRHLHYWYVEASDVDPSKAPVVLWLNGGPGCSSMEGLLRENGPFRVNDRTVLQLNPYSWNKIANVLYLEAPAGVGYSYAEGGNTTTDDNQVADDNHQALKSFFTKFPEVADNDFFITGESYAGVYIPTLAARVLKDKEIHLIGVAIGNGLSSYHLNSNSLLYYMYNHGIMGDQFWYDMYTACCDKCAGALCDFLNNTTPKCTNLLNKASELINGLDIYNMFAPCHGGIPDQDTDFSSADDLYPFGSRQSQLMRKLMNRFIRKSKSRQISSRSLSLLALRRGFSNNKLELKDTNSNGIIPCVNDTALTSYMNDPLVRYALHIKKNLPAFTICSILDYHTVYNDLTDVYKKNLLPSNLRILLYNGDADMACNYLGDQWFLDNLNMPVRKSRKPWYFHDKKEGKQIGGYAKQWKHVTFVTVRGAGHMVPEDKPQQAFTMFDNFLRGKDF